MRKPRLVILDRDGVINEDSDHYIKSPGEFRMIPGSARAIALLKGAGYRVAVATNQSGVARGLFSRETLRAIHEKLEGELRNAGASLDLIKFCPHGPDDGCRCRKPLPGLLEAIGEELDTDLHGVPVVGDSLRDLQAARAVGGRPILVRTGKGERTLSKGEGLEGVEIHDDLLGAVEALLAEDGEGGQKPE
jgi:D-glycero-D-manno-heptose 1,7-bisphosphate phosphatase